MCLKRSKAVSSLWASWFTSSICLWLRSSQFSSDRLSHLRPKSFSTTRQRLLTPLIMVSILASASTSLCLPTSAAWISNTFRKNGWEINKPNLPSLSPSTHARKIQDSQRPTSASQSIWCALTHSQKKPERLKVTSIHRSLATTNWPWTAASTPAPTPGPVHAQALRNRKPFMKRTLSWCSITRTAMSTWMTTST